ncbi:proline utilization trans-activator [Microdochium nivale]|nr:proline utilization trans-activator [Microdochium nivale]
MFHRTNPSEEDCMPKAFAAASMATQKMVAGRHKPMRLGTKSCLECRRRKVRCIVATGTTRCRQCLLHKVRCISQGPSPPAGVLDQEPDQLGGQRKLQLPLSEFPKLKAIFDRLSYHGTGDVSSAKLGPTPADDSVQFSQWLAAALESLLSDEPDKLSSHHYESPSVLATGNNDTSTTSGNGAFATAPLLHYLRTTLVPPHPNERAHSSPVAGTRGSSWQGPARRGSWLSLVPERNFLQSIFIMTQPFWSVWPLSSHFPADIVQACAFMGDELLRCTDGGAAKRLAWLALCISQLPRDFGGHHGFAPMGLRPADLVANLLDASRELAMASIEQSSNSKINSLDSLEALVMQYKCLLSQGRPRQGWKCARAGVDNALLFGLHRTKTAVSLNEREQGIWTALWRADRQMALFLGVPYSVPEHFLGTNERHGSSQQQQAPEDDIFELTMIICGHIVERDHLGSQSAYS